jgi:hypothetical protein
MCGCQIQINKRIGPSAISNNWYWSLGYQIRSRSRRIIENKSYRNIVGGIGEVQEKLLKFVWRMLVMPSRSYMCACRLILSLESNLTETKSLTFMTDPPIKHPPSPRKSLMCVSSSSSNSHNIAEVNRLPVVSCQCLRKAGMYAFYCRLNQPTWHSREYRYWKQGTTRACKRADSAMWPILK